MRKMFVSVAFLLSASCASFSIADEGTSAGTSPPTQQVHGRGHWGLAPRASISGWTLDALRFSNGEVRGRIRVANSPVIGDANLEGKVVGDAVEGQIVDDSGSVLAQFTGKISASGMAGKYKDRTGEVGDWHWEGTIPPLTESAAGDEY